MVRPDREGFRALAQRGGPVLLVREVLADFDTPLAIFRKLDDGRTAFLFESMEGEERWSRYSFIGIGARVTFVARGRRLRIEQRGRVREIELPEGHTRDPLEELRALLERERPAPQEGLPRFIGGAVGYLAYDWVRYIERLPDANPDELGVADCFFRFPETVLVHDRRLQRLSIVHWVDVEDASAADRAYADGVAAIARVEAALARPLAPEPAPGGGCLEPDAPRSNVTRERYREMVERARSYIRAGDAFQVVPSQRLSLPLRADPFQIYRCLRTINPSPYLFYLRGDDHVVIGSSPEILVRLEGRQIALRPIAGTHPRGRDAAEDAALERKLLADPKELAEHVMLVDLGRNDVGRVAEIGSVRVSEFETIERYSHVMHIVSNVVGRLRPGLDAIDLLRATFPEGTVTGAPKVRAMEIIDELEPVRRGLYGGSVGYIDARGDMDMCIAIRTLLVKNGMVYAQAGGGVVADSDPETEYQESLHKAGAVLEAIRAAGRRS